MSAGRPPAIDQPALCHDIFYEQHAGIHAVWPLIQASVQHPLSCKAWSSLSIMSLFCHREHFIVSTAHDRALSLSEERCVKH